MILNLATIGTSNITEEFIQAAKLTGLYSYHASYSRKIEKAEQFAPKNRTGRAENNLIVAILNRSWVLLRVEKMLLLRNRIFQI